MAVLTILLLGVICGSSGRANASAATIPPFGVASVSTLIGGTDDTYATEASAIRDTGAQWIRVVVPWNLLEPAPGDYRWQNFDAAVRAASTAGLRILVLIAGVPPLWAQRPGYDQGCIGIPPADPAAFGTFARIVAEHYKSSVSAWEIWNEPNINDFFQPVDVALYAEMLKSAYTNIHAVQPDATVISGGLSAASDGIESVEFIRQLYAHGAGDFFDAVGLHPYTFPYSITDTPQGETTIVEAHRVMAEYGQADKKIWITEYGQATGTSEGAVSELKQRQIILYFLQRTSVLPYLGPSFLFTSRDLSDDPTRHDFNFGLYRVDYQPKLVVSALRSFV